MHDLGGLPSWGMCRGVLLMKTVRSGHGKARLRVETAQESKSDGLHYACYRVLFYSFRF